MIRQSYVAEDLCYRILVDCDDRVVNLRCDRELESQELELIREVITDTLTINDQLSQKS